MPRIKYAMNYHPKTSFSMSYVSRKVIFPGDVSCSLQRVIDYSCTSGESQITAAVLRMNINKIPGISQSLFGIPALVRRHSQVVPKFSPALRHPPKVMTVTPIFLLYQSSKIQVISKAGRNAILGSDSLLKLTLVSLHSASSHTPLEAPSD